MLISDCQGMFVIFLLGLWSVIGYAHTPGLSSLDATVGTSQVELKITFALQDIEAFIPMDSDFDADVSDAERTQASPKISDLLSNQLILEENGQRILPKQSANISYDQQNNAQVVFTFPFNIINKLTIHAEYLTSFPVGHQQFFTLKASDGKVISQKMLSQQDRQFQIKLATTAQETELNGSSGLAVFLGFFKLGVEHILTGYDHLLFLLALLVVTRSFWAAIKIITLFTIAHSVTLALAGLDIVNLPSHIVEPLIALSIVYVGLENLIQRGEPKGRGLLTFSFGFVHGFGFASVLKEMGISTAKGGILVPLVSFNLGVEAGQIAVTALVLSVIIWVCRNPAIVSPVVKIISASVSVAGMYWLVERTVL